jgi:hypothetical protein
VTAKLHALFTTIFLSTIAVGDLVAQQASPAAGKGDSLSRGVRALVDGGLSRCVSELDALVKDQTNSDDAYGYVTHPSTTPNKDGSALITAADYSDGAVIRTFHVVPAAGGGCSILVNLTFVSTESCARVRDEGFAEWKFMLDLGSSTAYEAKADTDYHNTAVLTRTKGGGCAVTKILSFNYE